MIVALAAPIHLIICIYLVYQRIGMAAFAGAGVLLALLPLNVYVCEFTRMQGHKDTMIQCHNDVMIQGKKDAMTHSKMAIFKKSILLKC